jgi:histone acetyltransferase
MLISEKDFKKIPGISESGWDFKDYENMIKNDYSNINFFTQCRNLVTKIKNNKNSWPFLKPVDQSEVPDYYEVIKEPMDVQTLESNLESGHYKSRETFIKDLKKIFSNAKVYNKPHTIYHKYAKDIENSIDDDIKNLKDS